MPRTERSPSPEIDKAVRSALVPRLADDADSDLTKFSTPADGFGAPGSLASNEAPISVTTLKASALERIQELLIRGERRQACHYALDEKLWAHAMVIASSIDRDAWQEVIKEFIRAELGSGDVKDGAKPNDPRQGSSPTPTLDGHESLRVAYSLFTGQGAASGIYTHSSSCGNNRLILCISASNASFPLAFTGSRQASATRRPSRRHACDFKFRGKRAYECPRGSSGEMGRDCCDDVIQLGVV